MDGRQQTQDTMKTTAKPKLTYATNISTPTIIKNLYRIPVPICPLPAVLCNAMVDLMGARYTFMPYTIKCTVRAVNKEGKPDKIIGRIKPGGIQAPQV